MDKNILKIIDNRKINKIVYFHVDHFEPFTGPGRIFNIEGVHNFIKETKKYKHSKIQSLFIPIPFARTLEERDELSFTSENDDIFFSISPKKLDDVSYSIKLLQEEGYDINVHIHHEHWTNTGIVNKKNKDDKVSNLIKRKNYKSDSLRFETVLQKSLGIFSKALNMDFKNSGWSFIHGCWALNGSDNDICNIDDEIVILHRNGCAADFSFPAGRGKCDPFIKNPFSVKPIKKIRSYDDKVSEPKKIYNKNRFLIWNSEIKHGNSSLDFYSDSIKKRISDPNYVVKNWLKKSNIIENTLFIKTHSHSMDLRYWDDFSNPELPTTNKNILKAFNLIYKVCENKNIEFESVGVRDIIKKLIKQGS